MKRQVILYSSQKFHETGAGVISKSITLPYESTDEEIQEEIKKIKLAQKEENAEFKKQLRLHNNDSPIYKISTTKNEREITPKKPTLILDEGTGNTLFIVGSSKAGKSYALIKVYEEYYKEDPKTISILFTDSPQSPHYKYLRKEGLIVCPEGGFNDEAQSLIMKIKALQTKLDNPIRFLLMFDDVLNIRYSSIIQKALLVYRNSYISTIISIQYPNLLNKSMRANINNVFLFRFNSDETIEVAIKAFCGSYEPFISLPSMEQKIKKYKELTMDHKFIYINPANAAIEFCKY